MSAPAPLLGEKQTSGGRLAATDLMSTPPNSASCAPYLFIVRRAEPSTDDTGEVWPEALAVPFVFELGRTLASRKRRT